MIDYHVIVAESRHGTRSINQDAQLGVGRVDTVEPGAVRRRAGHPDAGSPCLASSGTTTRDQQGGGCKHTHRAERATSPFSC